MNNFIKKIGYTLWRVWFYILLATAILIMFPILLVLSSREKWYAHFFWFARNIWANAVLYPMGFFPRIEKEQKLQKKASYMLIANHTSMLDIMLMLRVSKNPFVFVGKKELAKIPIFGFFYKRVCILVDRADPKSRVAVYQSAKKRLDTGLSICIFPEGGVPEQDVFLDAFKDGAFRLAIQHQIPIVPITFLDNKKRFPYTFFGGVPGVVRAKVHTFLPTKGKTQEDKKDIKQKARTIIYKQLQQDITYKKSSL